MNGTAALWNSTVLSGGCGLNRQMTDLHPDDRGLDDEGEMPAHVRTAKPCPGRITPMLVPELAAQYEYLLTTEVGVGLKAFACRPLDQRNMFPAKVVQRHHFEAPLAGQPSGRPGIDTNT